MFGDLRVRGAKITVIGARDTFPGPVMIPVFVRGNVCCCNKVSDPGLRALWFVLVLVPSAG